MSVVFPCPSCGKPVYPETPDAVMSPATKQWQHKHCSKSAGSAQAPPSAAVSERRVAPLCEWTGGLVRYKLQPATFGILILAARGPGDNVRVVSLGKTDGSASDWIGLSVPERTARAERLFRHDWEAIHHVR